MNFRPATPKTSAEPDRHIFISVEKDGLVVTRREQLRHFISCIIVELDGRQIRSDDVTPLDACPEHNTQSVAYQIIRSKWPEFEWVRLDRATELRHMRRTVVVHYYARAHQASRTLWDSPRGRRYLTAIGNDIASRVTADRHIWTCNRNERSLFERPDHETSLLPGKCLSPRQQGSNLWSCRNEATILFTAKPSACDLSIAKVIGISPEAIVETRELDIMVQFACRTSVRVAESTETVHLYVYDEVQARHLEAYFQSTGYCDVVLDLIDIPGMGIAEYKRDSTPGRKVKVLISTEK